MNNVFNKSHRNYSNCLIVFVQSSYHNNITNFSDDTTLHNISHLSLVYYGNPYLTIPPESITSIFVYYENHLFDDSSRIYIIYTNCVSLTNQYPLPNTAGTSKISNFLQIHDRSKWPPSETHATALLTEHVT